jgi:predicted ArsR family transcriptional regulator
MANPNLSDHRPAYRTKVNAGIYALMIYLLVEGATVTDIMEETGLRKDTVRKYVNALYNQHALRIVRWDHDKAGRRNMAVYKLEIRSRENRDIVRPSMTMQERRERYRAKKRAAKMRALDTAWLRKEPECQNLSQTTPLNAKEDGTRILTGVAGQRQSVSTASVGR